MLKSLLNILRGKLDGDRHPGAASRKSHALEEDTTPIFEGLAMTDELREALFPTTPQMISAIFDRPAPLGRPPAAPPQSSPAGGEGFPVIF